MDSEKRPVSPVITPNGLPQNQEAPGGSGFGEQSRINWQPPTESQIPPDWKPGTGNQMPSNNNQNS